MKGDQMNIGPDPAASASAAKAGAVWLGVAIGKLGIHTWSDVAAIMAAVYSGLLIVGWVWRAWVRWRLGKALVPVDTGRCEL